MNGDFHRHRLTYFKFNRSAAFLKPDFEINATLSALTAVADWTDRPEEIYLDLDFCPRSARAEKAAMASSTVGWIMT